MPMPVIRTCRIASAMLARLQRELESFAPRLHGGAELRAGKFHHLERELCIAYGLAVDGDAGRRNGVARALVHEVGGKRQELTRRHEGAQLGLLDGGQE